MWPLASPLTMVWVREPWTFLYLHVFVLGEVMEGPVLTALVLFQDGHCKIEYTLLYKHLNVSKQ